MNIQSRTKERRLNSSRLLVNALATLLAVWFTGAFAFQTPGSGGDIHNVDFKNFTYRSDCDYLDHPSVRVTKGSYHKKTDHDEALFEVTGVAYGDLTRDGQDEAVITTSCAGSGSMVTSEAFVYAMKNGKPSLVATVEGGDRANGGIKGAKIEKGLLKVETYDAGSGPACCPKFVITTSYRLSGRKLVQAGHPARRKVPREPGEPEDKAQRIQFEPGKSSAVIKGQSSSGDEYLVRARAGQTIHVKVTSPSDGVTVWVESDVGEEINYPGWDTEWTGKLPITGDYRITVATGPKLNTYTLEVTIR